MTKLQRCRRQQSPSPHPPADHLIAFTARLSEIESLQEEWQLQAEAQDEVERLLRTTAY